MASQTLRPQTPEEHVVWFAIRATYLFYAAGALYVVAPALGWLLAGYALVRARRRTRLRPKSSGTRLPLAIWLWIAGMLMMLMALIIGHLDHQLGIAQTLKSVVGWAKGWALLAVFPFLGCLRIRPELVYRATGHVCLHTLVALPIFIGAWLAAAPPTLYVSPLAAVGGPGPEFFAVSLYEIDPGSGLPRWRLFTPWAPALGFVANVCFVFALHERDRRWRWVGIAGAVVMVLMSASRLALVAMPLVSMAMWLASRPRGPAALLAGGVGTAWSGLAGAWLIDSFERAWQAFRAARADSTRVREALARIALDRWRTDAPMWGHGTVERGPHLVEFMPIGSHHTWYGLLFVKGLVGAVALALPLLFSLAELALWSRRLPVARVGFGLALLLLAYTFGENLEILAYLIWPALLVMGAAHRDIAVTRRRNSSNRFASTRNPGDFDHA